MVLANPDLVPTIVRAGLLEDKFYPTEPARSRDKKFNDNYPSMSERQAKRRKAKPEQPKPSRQDIIGATTKAVNQTKGSIDAAGEAAERMDTGGLTEADASKAAERRSTRTKSNNHNGAVEQSAKSQASVY